MFLQGNQSLESIPHSLLSTRTKLTFFTHFGAVFAWLVASGASTGHRRNQKGRHSNLCGSLRHAAFGWFHFGSSPGFIPSVETCGMMASPRSLSLGLWDPGNAHGFKSQAPSLHQHISGVVNAQQSRPVLPIQRVLDVACGSKTRHLEKPPSSSVPTKASLASARASKAPPGFKSVLGSRACCQDTPPRLAVAVQRATSIAYGNLERPVAWARIGLSFRNYLETSLVCI